MHKIGKSKAKLNKIVLQENQHINYVGFLIVDLRL